MASDELAEVRDMLAGIDLGPLSVTQRRAAFAATVQDPPPGTVVEQVDAGGVTAEWVAGPGVGTERTLVWLHGGAYHVGSPAVSRHLAGLLSVAAAVRVLSVDYRLAPEHPFPAALEDARRAYAWVLGCGVPAAAVALGGDSAGGGLALAALVAARDDGVALPAAAAVISPWTDLAGTGDSMRTRATRDVMVHPDGLHEAAAWYLAGEDRRHPLASPLYADLTGLPPILIQVGDAEVLLDDSTRFAARATAAGVSTTLEVWDEMIHVWHAFAGLLPEADEAIRQFGRWLDAKLAPV